MALLDEIVAGLMLAGVGLAALFAVLAIYNTTARNMRAQKAIGRAAGNTWAVVGGFVGLTSMAFVQFFTAIDIVTMAVANHPIAATNLVTAGLGLLGIEGLLSQTSFFVAVVGFVGGFLLIAEVRG